MMNENMPTISRLPLTINRITNSPPQLSSLLQIKKKNEMARIRFRRPSTNTYQLLLNLTNRHIHAQLVDRTAGRVLVAAHTNEPTLRHKIGGSDVPPKSYVTSTVSAARHVGQQFAERASAKGITAVYWQRPGKYHGKIKAFIDAVREAGIETKLAPKPDMPPVPQINN